MIYARPAGRALPLLLLSWLAGCQGAAPRAPLDGGADLAMTLDGGTSTDASMNADGDLFNQLFGAHDPFLPGRSCLVRRDDCRGSRALMVCVNGSCQPCASDQDCETEYAYLDPFGGNLVCVNGSCELSGTPIGTCNASNAGTACRTAQQGWFPCVNGVCVACGSSAQCMADYGPNWLCEPFQNGQCLESLPTPGD